MKIAVAADHGGFELKNIIKEYLTEKGNEIVDFGTNSPESVDYPDYALLCAREVVSGNVDFGILFCGTGVGISIAANKVKGIRCALCPSPEIASLTKEHNNANIISLGGRFTSPEYAKEIVDAYMSAQFAGDRHQKRINKISDIENL